MATKKNQNDEIIISEDEITSARGELTKKEIEQLKTKHKGLFEMVLTDEETGESYACYLKRPKFSVRSNMIMLAQQSKLMEAGELLLVNCWVDGAEEIKADKDSELYAAACQQVYEIITNSVAVTVKKL